MVQVGCAMRGSPGVRGVAIEIPEVWRERVGRLFPELEEGTSLEFTSEVDFNYNCLSWALGCNSLLFENSKGAYWIWPNIPDDTADGWAQLAEIFGFNRTTNTEFVPGYEKVAIFEKEKGDLHAARSRRDGVWKSKLGILGPDIDHIGLSGLESAYGRVVVVLEKHRPDWNEE
jgi:hypothetical protein